ncbi:MAG: hypothetical protein FWG64_09480 [Firmicutes bacterium]|nr:hypothetical protein [Bacillota bacterium]
MFGQGKKIYESKKTQYGHVELRDSTTLGKYAVFVNGILKHTFDSYNAAKNQYDKLS